LSRKKIVYITEKIIKIMGRTRHLIYRIIKIAKKCGASFSNNYACPK